MSAQKRKRDTILGYFRTTGRAKYASNDKENIENGADIAPEAVCNRNADLSSIVPEGPLLPSDEAAKAHIPTQAELARMLHCDEGEQESPVSDAELNESYDPFPVPVSPTAASSVSRLPNLDALDRLFACSPVSQRDRVTRVLDATSPCTTTGTTDTFHPAMQAHQPPTSPVVPSPQQLTFIHHRGPATNATRTFPVRTLYEPVVMPTEPFATGIVDLCEDVVFFIMDGLSFRDCNNLASVNKHLRAICASDDYWGERCFSDFGQLLLPVDCLGVSTWRLVYHALIYQRTVLRCTDVIVPLSHPHAHLPLDIQHLFNLQHGIALDPDAGNAIEFTRHDPAAGNKIPYEVVVDWMLEIVSQFPCSQRTLHLAVHVFSNCIVRMPLTLDQLQVLGSVCLFIAGKYLTDQVASLRLADILDVTMNMLSRDRVRLLELSALQAINYKLEVATRADFLAQFLFLLRPPRAVALLATYLTEMSLLDWSMNGHDASMVAACTLYCAMKRYAHVWMEIHEKLTRMKEPELLQCDCIHQLAILHSSIQLRSNHTVHIHDRPAIHSRYSTVEHNFVANLPPFIHDFLPGPAEATDDEDIDIMDF